MAMPLCVVVDTDGRLVSQGEFSGDCTGWILVTPADWAGSMTLAKLFEFPDPVAFGAVFGSTFGLILFLAAIASMVGTVAGFFDSTDVEIN